MSTEMECYDVELLLFFRFTCDTVLLVAYSARLSEGPGMVWPALLRYLGCESGFGAHNIFGKPIYLSHSSEADVYRNGIL